MYYTYLVWASALPSDLNGQCEKASDCGTAIRSPTLSFFILILLDQGDSDN